ncbi:TolC family protein [Parabacteroides sp. FAFU027]|uniref:TolC family protein n=1 Tax=Parabacteroides sp. FAFU027 TaxID=2922715 RepID=UPI001FAFB17E|nr:TolC family protein [Parabacteroides sp. FAFU027]
MKIGVFGIVVVCSVVTAQAQQKFTLEDCRRMAIDNNKELKISQEKITEEHSKKKAAFTKYLPDVSFTGTYLRNSKNISLLSEDAYLPVGTVMSDGSFGFRADQVNNSWTMVNGSAVPLDKNGNPFNPKTNPEKILWKDYAIIPKEAFEMDMKNVFAGILTVTQPIYMGGKIKAYNEITKFAEELAKTKHNTNRQDIILKTDENYWQVVSLANKKKLAEGYVKLLQKLDADVQTSIATGVATKADGLTVKVKLNEAETVLSKVENGLSLSRMSLCQLCGISLQSEFILNDENTPTEPEMVIASGDANRAFTNRPELKSLDLATKIYKKKESLVIADLLPQVAMTGSYILSNPNSYNGYETKFGGMWNVGVAVHVPIFHWGENFHNLKAAKSETRVAQLQLDEVKEKIELQVNQAVYKSNEASKRLIAAKKNMEKAEENLRYATLGFNEGVIPASNVLEAQTAWLSANSEKIDAEIDVRLCKVYLAKALGENLDLPNPSKGGASGSGK